MDLNVFVPNGDSREDTAVLLTGTAREYKIDQREIKATNGGFFISDRLADIVYDGEVPEEDEPLDTSEVEPLAPEDPEEPEATPDYAAWEYGDLKHEVATRGLETENQKAETLVAALEADDAEAQAE